MSRSKVPPAILALLIILGPLAGCVSAASPAGHVADRPGLEWPGEMQGGANDMSPEPIWLRAGRFLPGTDALPTVLDLEGASSPGVYLVQFQGPLSPGLGSRLSSLGASVLGYVPEDALVVRVPLPATALSLVAWRDVRWACPWQDGWKVHPVLEGARGTLELTVLTWRAGQDVAGELDGAGARVLGHLLDQYVVRARAASVPTIAAMGGVCWIEPWVAPTLAMDNAARMVGARQAQDGDLDTEGTAVWSYVEGLDVFDGLTGRSVTVDITDTGVDGTHQAFAGRTEKYTAIEPGRLDWTDPIGHGTHVAGIVLGDGSYRLSESPTLPDGKYAGMAPGAYMLAQSLYGPGLTYFYKNLTRWSVRNGADISQNSWGTFGSSVYGEYNVGTRDYDNATRDADWTTPGNQSILVVFSAGNSGYNGSAVINDSISPQASAKNVISVGAVGNEKDSYSDRDVLMLSSSRGYTDDGRFKPDLVAPGDNVTSTWASDDGGSSGIKPSDSGTHSYINFGGTSMAAPVVSGAAALVIDHMRTREGHADPSPALVKSMLIASADHLPGVEWPGREQGWGRVNASRAIVEARTLTTEWFDQSTAFSTNGDSVTYRFDVGADEPLRVALVWTDVSSVPYAVKTLVNDLDLEVRSPSGTVYRGNVFTSGQSVAGGDGDRTNNVEMVYMDTPEVGEWTVTVSSHELPPVGTGVQDFALSVIGNVNKKFIDLAAQNLSVRATDASEGDVIPIIFDLANLGNLPATAVAWRLEVRDELGDVVATLASGIDDLAPRSGIRIFANWTSVRGAYTVKATPNPFRHIIEESYQNNDATKAMFIKGFGVSAEIRTSLLAALPGTTATFKVNVTNTGNTDDLFLLDRSVPPQGWNARLDVSYLDIQPGKVRSANLLVTVPDDAPADTTARVNVTVVSQGNGTHRSELSTQTQVLPVYRLELDLDQRSVSAAPGDELTVDFNIVNLGNAPDTYKLSLAQVSGSTLGVDLSMGRTTFTVLSGEVVSGNLTVRFDSGHALDLPVGETITYNVRAVSVNQPSAGDVATGSVVIKQLHAVSIPPPQEVEFFLAPGDPVIFVIDFANDGNGLETLSPELVVPDGWDWEYDGGDISIEIGGTRSAQFEVLTPNNALEGAHTVTVVALSGTQALATYDLSFSVDWAPSISLRLEGTSERNLTRGSELAFEFRVTNTGNAPDMVTVVVDHLTRGLTVDTRPASMSLGVDEVGTFTVVFNASTDAELLRGTYDLRFRFAEETRFEPISVIITVKLASGGGPSGPGDDDGDKDTLSFGVLLLLAGLVAAAVAIVVALAVLSKKKRSSRLDEEAFFGKEEPKAPDYLAEEASKRPLPPPPPPPRVKAPEEPPDARPDEVPVPVVTSYSRGTSCPECGNAMEPLGPAGPGMYCPMCGHKEGGG